MRSTYSSTTQEGILSWYLIDGRTQIISQQQPAAVGIENVMIGKQTGCLIVQMSGWHTLEPMPQRVMATQASEMVYRILLPALHL